MPWFKIDDGFYDHPKVDDLSLSAVGLWTMAGTWCAKQLTDGHVTPGRVRKFGATDDVVAELVACGLWVADGPGWQFKNWEQYQPTRESVESQREYERERKRKQRRNPSGQFTESHEGPASVTAGHGSDTERDANGSHTVPTRPDPTRPQERARTRRAPEVPLPADWAPKEAHATKAKEKNLDLALEAETFKNHALSHDRRLRDWDRGFNNWLLKAKPRPKTDDYSPWEVSSYVA